MYLLESGKRVLEVRQGQFFYFENPCDEHGGHEYADRICSKCGRDFCFNCCGKTNVHCGGKHEADFMLCPECGHDIYQD